MKINNNSTLYNNHYSLSIRFSTDGFSLYVWDKDQKLLSSYNTEINIFDKTETEIFDILSNQEELKLDFKSIRFIVENSFFSLIPAPFFNTEMGTEILKFKFQDFPKEDAILNNKIIPWDALIVFTCKPAIYNAIKKVLPKLRIEHHLFSFITNNIPLNNHSGVYVRFRKELFDVIVIIDGKPMLVNTFTAQTPEDFLYYILQIIENFKLDKSIDLTIFNAEKKANHLQLVKKYLTNCETKTEI